MKERGGLFTAMKQHGHDPDYGAVGISELKDKIVSKKTDKAPMEVIGEAMNGELAEEMGAQLNLETIKRFARKKCSKGDKRSNFQNCVLPEQ